MQRWTKEQARHWQEKHGWLVGFNYLPRTAGNWIEMWQEEDFAAGIINQELGWAAAVGYNCLRTNLSYQVWADDREGLHQRLEDFLALCNKHAISVILTLMDDCEFSDQPPTTGKQPAPLEGIHNSIALGSPGRRFVCQPNLWPKLEHYIKDIIETYQQDERVICWDLYNEPTNRMVFSTKKDADYLKRFPESFSHDLMIQTFQWAREINPSQPLTVAAWKTLDDNSDYQFHFDNDTDQLALSLSDIITFHGYTSNEEMQKMIAAMKAHERPIMCTEWMARHANSTIKQQLPLLKRHHVSCFQWGLVNGRTQTHIPWPHIKVDNMEKHLWFHDLLYADGTPYDNEEIAVLKQLVD